MAVRNSRTGEMERTASPGPPSLRTPQPALADQPPHHEAVLLPHTGYVIFPVGTRTNPLEPMAFAIVANHDRDLLEHAVPFQ